MKYTVVVDFEMCEVPVDARAQYPYSQEIIQIGAALLDEAYRITDTFSGYVKPRFGYLSKTIEKLTGIQPEDLVDAPDISDAIESFCDWLPKGDVTVVAWSDNDERQLRRETELKQISSGRIDQLLSHWVDCQPMFAKKMDNHRAYSLEEALIASDIVTEGRAHDGLVDATNTALLYAKMMTEDEYKLNPYYEIANRKEPVNFGVSLGDLLAGLDFGVCQAV